MMGIGGQITRSGLSDDRRANILPSVAGFFCDLLKYKGYLENVGLILYFRLGYPENALLTRHQDSLDLGSLNLDPKKYLEEWGVY